MTLGVMEETSIPTLMRPSHTLLFPVPLQVVGCHQAAQAALPCVILRGDGHGTDRRTALQVWGGVWGWRGGMVTWVEAPLALNQLSLHPPSCPPSSLRTGLFDGVVALVHALLAYGPGADASAAGLQVGP